MALTDAQLRSIVQAAQSPELGARFAALLAVDADAGTVSTWDPDLSRHHRLLVPIDVQALVVPDGADEPMVRVAGRPGDPPPLVEGSPRPTGVHLHWAMPDALLRGVQGDDEDLELPTLPDRWVVVRTVRPTGAGTALVRGWVIDAVRSAVAPLAAFAGEFPAVAADTPVFDPLDAVIGGSPSWTASYEASVGRFGFHDPLDDLRADGHPTLDRELAVYTVAGWWADPADDPLRGAAGIAGVDRTMADLGWTVDHGERADEEQATQLLATMRGLGASPDDETPVTVVAGRERTVFRHDQLGLRAGIAVDDVAEVVVGRHLSSFSTLLHGAVVGVPVGGGVPGTARDGRPDPARMTVALGLDTDDVVAALGAGALPAGDRTTAEHVLAAFSADMLDRLRQQDGIADILEHEHAEAFWALPGPPLSSAEEDVLRTDDGLPVTPDTHGRKGRSALASSRDLPSATARWQKRSTVIDDGSGPPWSVRRSDERRTSKQRATGRPAGTGATSRRVRRPAPRMYRPSAPVIAVRGAAPHARHHHDAADTDRGLFCRYPDDAVTGIKEVVSGRDVVPTLGSGAIPDEVLVVVREALLLDQTGATWLAGAASTRQDDRATETGRRIDAEHVRVWDADGRYDPTGRFSAYTATGGQQGGEQLRWAAVLDARRPVFAQIAAELARRSSYEGTPPSPVALTPWRQPWSPLWIEWEATAVGSTRLDGWRLGELDLETTDGVPGGTTLTLTGRNPVGRGAAIALQHGVRTVLEREAQLDTTRDGELSRSEADALATLAGIDDDGTPLDVVSASLDGLHEQLLGIAYVGGMQRRVVDGRELVVADGDPHPLFGGTLRLERARLVDAFGRTVELDVDEVATTQTLETDGGHLLLRPRVQHGARALLRLVDPAHPVDADPLAAREAFVDQVRPDLQVNPIAGYLLPDHVDEALEAFTVDGAPLGQVLHDPITGAVAWEIAPGRPLPPDAGPFADIPPSAGPVARIAAGLLEVDARARAEGDDGPTALTELLRVVDTTLWTVDTFAALGTPTVAGLVGRPIAVVRATLRLDLPDDIDEVVVDAPGGPDARRAAFAALHDQAFPVRLGSLVRSDDSLVGFVLDDDHHHVRVVDKAVTANARSLGRHRGYLGLLGSHEVPDVEPVDHPYLVAEDELWLRPGQVVRLTLLMLPAGRVHLTTGVLPRKSLQLADAWTDGLARLSPSVRVGPVLVDPSEIRMPLIHSLGEEQTFTRRTGPLTWRDDPIAAASQAALLPRTPHEVQEGWVRVTPEEEAP